MKLSYLLFLGIIAVSSAKKQSAVQHKKERKLQQDQCNTYRIKSASGTTTWEASPTYNAETDCINNKGDSVVGDISAISGEALAELSKGTGSQTATVTDATCKIVGAALKNGDQCEAAKINDAGHLAEFMSPSIDHVEMIVQCCPEDDCDDGDDTVVTTRNGGSFGDPHLKTWKGKLYDFHGECDLVLVHSENFANDKGLDIHIRTTIRHDWSFISGAVVRIGDDILEVASGGLHWLNGVENAPMPAKVGGFKTTFTQHGKSWNKFVVELGKKEGKIYIKSFDEFLAVSIKGAHGDYFGDAVGMMGTFGAGEKIGRDGQQIFEDNVAFGMEWQVRDTEPMLFQEAKGPQWPQVCRMPEKPTKTGRRRLDESSVSYADALAACKEWPEEERDTCIYDVMSTGELSMAEAGVF